ncbi:MAG: response regulator transcription factor [Acidobacteria bacterium]|nr:response regulator transcription factor [Acidobacteriota bacterium]
MRRVLVIDDDRDTTELLAKHLREEGFNVESSADGVNGVQRALGGGLDLVILDLELPRKSGLAVLGEIRRASSVPVIVVTARDHEADRVAALELGADDYIGKPFSTRELLARIRVVFRRIDEAAARAGTRRNRALGIRIDRGARRVFVAGREIGLTGVEFALLERLVRDAGEVVSREILFMDAMGRPATASDRSLDVHISKLRRKLGPLPDGGQRIKSVRGSGYLFVRPHQPGDVH